MTTDTAQQALVVRNGWDGHQPVEATDSVGPFLRAHGFTVGVHDSPAYADADVMAGTDLVVQCSTTSTIGKEELWARQRGRGRIAVCTPGHNLEVLAIPTIIERGMLWASR